MLLLSLGVVIVAVGLTIAVVGSTFARRRPLDPRVAALRIAAAAAVLSLGSAVMRIVGDPVVLVVSVNLPADTAIVLSAGLLCVAMSMTQERHARIAAGATLLTGLVVATVTVLLPPDVARIALLCALTVTCGACAILALRNTALPRTPIRVIAVAMSFYALHCAVRALALATVGSETAFASAPFGISALVAALTTNLAVGVALVILFVPVARETKERSRALTTLTIRDGNLVADPYGMARARQLVSELQSAARDRDPAAVIVRHGVATALPSPLDALTEPLTYEYGWQPEEISLIVADASPRRV